MVQHLPASFGQGKDDGATKEQHVVHKGFMRQRLNSRELQSTDVWQVHAHAQVCLRRSWMVRHDSFDLPALDIAAARLCSTRVICCAGAYMQCQYIEEEVA